MGILFVSGYISTRLFSHTPYAICPLRSCTSALQRCTSRYRIIRFRRDRPSWYFQTFPQTSPYIPEAIIFGVTLTQPCRPFLSNAGHGSGFLASLDRRRQSCGVLRLQCFLQALRVLVSVSAKPGSRPGVRGRQAPSQRSEYFVTTVHTNLGSKERCVRCVAHAAYING